MEGPYSLGETLKDPNTLTSPKRLTNVMFASSSMISMFDTTDDKLTVSRQQVLKGLT